MNGIDQARVLLDWHIVMGIDETIAEHPVDNFAPPEPVTTVAPEALHDMAPATQLTPQAARPAAIAAPITVSPATPPPSGEASVQSATELAAVAKTFDDLQAALTDFDGCALKKTVRE